MHEEFVARIMIVAEIAEHGARGHIGVMLHHTTYHRAHVLRRHDYGNPARIQYLDEELGNLPSEALLHL